MQPELINRTPFAATLLLLGGANEGPLFGVALVQATFAIQANGQLQALERQPEVDAAGDWYGDPAITSCRVEPQIATVKLSTDVVLQGHVIPVGGRKARQAVAGIQLGPIRKHALVFGERQLLRRLAGLVISEPEPFERMPLVHERAFGGWDRRDADLAFHSSERRNPVGVGYRHRRGGDCEEARLPNIEDPARLYRGAGDTPPPCGFGFVGAEWLPRAAYAGTYDAVWERKRKPQLPLDFDARFFNAASPGLVAPAPLRGNEAVLVSGMQATGDCAFRLPGVPPPSCLWSPRRGSHQITTAALDTIIIDMDRRWLTLQWRARWPLPEGPHALHAAELRLPVDVAALAPAV